MGELIIGLIKSALDVTEESLKLVNRKEQMKYIDRLHNLRRQLMHEESLGYNSDDARVEMLYGEIKITLETLRNEMAAISSNSNSK